MYVPIILGTAREGRQSEKVANYMLKAAMDYGLETEIIDVRDFRPPATDSTGASPLAQALGAKIARADGVIIVTPEYNHGYPGELKMALDLLYGQYARKPLGICGVSAGGLGGARAVEQLRLISVEFRMVPIREALYFPNVKDSFDEKGGIKDAQYGKRVKSFLDELTWYAKALKASR